jgi:hypothetical protein
MTDIRTHAAILFDLEKLASAALENAAILPSSEQHRIALEEELAATKSVKLLQAARTAIRQKSTQDLGEHFDRSKELAKRLRGSIIADLGPRNELLVNFGISPQRPRSRRQTTVILKKPTPIAPAEPEAAPDTKPNP